MKLIITRHGETEENKQGIIQGHLHGTLSDLGKEQAQKLAERLKDEKIDFIFSSDLARAKDTAEEIVKFHSEIPFELREELRERNWGKFQGGPHSEEFYSVSKDEEKLKEYNVETLEEGKIRINKLMNLLFENYEGKNVLVVSHAALIRLWISTLFNKSVEEIERHGNTGITIIEFDSEGKPELKLFNCTKHLE